MNDGLDEKRANLTPSPFPNGKGSSSEGGTSLAVRQFWAVATGEVPVHEARRLTLPSPIPNPSPNGRTQFGEGEIQIRVEMVVAEERYCLRCCGVRWFDVAVGVLMEDEGRRTVDRGGEERKMFATFCRCCGAEVQG